MPGSCPSMPEHLYLTRHSAEGPGNSGMYDLITAVPDKTLHWGAWKQWYVWPYQSSTWQDTALKALETEVYMYDRSQQYLTRHSAEGPESSGMYDRSQQYLTRHSTEGPGNRGMDDRSQQYLTMWLLSSVLVLVTITLFVVNTQHGLAWSLQWSLHPLSDWLCVCLTYMYTFLAAACILCLTGYVHVSHV